jgi:hypothetical protein
VPAGRYAVLGEGGARVGTEEFRCAPGPMGWRYFSDVQTNEPVPHRETIDVVTDADRRPIRLRVATGDHELFLQAQKGVLAGFRDGELLELAWGPDIHIDYYTPGTNAVTCMRLDGTSEIDVIYVEPYELTASRVRQRYELIGEEEVETPAGTFGATRWRFTALDSGWTGDLWIAGDTVIAYERLFTLEWFEPGATGAHPVR